MYQFDATCKCGYKSRTLCGHVAVCQSCSKLVNAIRIPFRYAFENCEECGGPIAEADLLGQGWLVFDQPSTITCPQCRENQIVFRMIAHLYVMHGTVFPEVGDVIQGYLEHGRLWIPDLRPV